MAGLIGSIGPYVDSEGWDSYVERLNLYFDVHDINEGKRLPAFLSIIGSNTYGVLKSLISPTPPSEHIFNLQWFRPEKASAVLGVCVTCIVGACGSVSVYLQHCDL